MKKSTLRALVVGINYENTKYGLNGCVQDMLSHIDLLINLGFKRNEITILTDAPIDLKNGNQIDLNYNKANDELKKKIFIQTNDKFPPILPPTPINFKNALIDAILEKDDNGKYITQLALIYAGHGFTKTDNNSDERDLMDETICLIEKSDIFNFTDDMISDTIISAYSKRTDHELTIYALFDCCHSGSIMDLPVQMIIRDTIILHTIIDTCYDKYSGLSVFCISGCMDEEMSGESKTSALYSEGYLSYFYRKAMYDRLNKIDNYIYPCYLYNLINSITKKVYEISKGRQTVVLSIKSDLIKNDKLMKTKEDFPKIIYRLGDFLL